MNTVDVWTEVRLGLVAYFLLCYGVGFIAKQKGRSDDYCRLASLILSPLLVFLYLLAVPSLPRGANSDKLGDTLACIVFFIAFGASQYFMVDRIKAAEAENTRIVFETNKSQSLQQSAPAKVPIVCIFGKGVTYKASRNFTLYSDMECLIPSQTMFAGGYFRVNRRKEGPTEVCYEIIVNNGATDYFMYSKQDAMGYPEPVY
jgi:hypothetical protein